MNKTLLGVLIAVLCTITVFAAGIESQSNQHITDGKIVPVATPQVTMNPVVEIQTTTEDAYQEHCQATYRYVWNHPEIELGVDYAVNQCQLVHKTVTYELTPCGKMVSAYDANGNKLPYRVHAHMCNERREVWTPVQI